jgi:hypothetical protein
MTAVRLSLPALVLAACGGGPAEPDRALPGTSPEISLRADPAGRTPVATVNGEPVYDDCVARQAEALHLELSAALEQCIDFELLAQEALRRGALDDPDIQRVRTREMVRELISEGYLPTMDQPSDIPSEDLTRLWDNQLRGFYNKPERRSAAYCRIPVDKKAPEGGEADLAARADAERLFRATRRLHFTPKLLALTCQLASGGRPIVIRTTPTRPFASTGQHERGRYATSFAEAAFSVAEVGQVSAPTRTNWGWDLLLVTEIRPEQRRSFAEAEGEIREQLLRHPDAAPYRARKFLAWSERFRAGLTIQIDPTPLDAESKLDIGPATRTP